ncbi:MAG: SpoIVB peptidase S55 domain-containing protein [Eubacteriales bacterium]
MQENTEAGIFGTATEHLREQLPVETLEVGYKQEIIRGEAWIRSAVSGEVRDYRIEIEEIHSSESDVNKGIVLRVADPELLALAGGIVQGMSGSPVIENGKIVGAVTHVFINDPTKGYGIFIENMLESAGKELKQRGCRVICSGSLSKSLFRCPKER